MLFELKLRRLTKAIYNVKNGLYTSNLPNIGPVRNYIFFKRIFYCTEEKQSMKEICFAIEQCFEKYKSIKEYLINNLSLSQDDFNHVAFGEYKEWLKNNKTKL